MRLTIALYYLRATACAYGVWHKKPASLCEKQVLFSNLSFQYYLPADKDTVGRRAMRVPDTVPLFDAEYPLEFSSGPPC